MGYRAGLYANVHNLTVCSWSGVFCVLPAAGIALACESGNRLGTVNMNVIALADRLLYNRS